MKKIFPSILFLVCIAYFFIAVNNYDWSLTNISYAHTGFLNGYTGKPLIKGTTIRIKIHPEYDHIGAILVRFSTFYRPKAKDEDRVIFRLFEESHGKLLYENTYRIAYGFGNTLFPFGFPQIENSSGKKYIAELSFLNGSNDDPLYIANREPKVLTRYSFPKSSLLSSGNTSIQFCYLKFIVPLSNPDYIYIVWISMLPILLWVLSERKLKKNRMIIQSSVYLLFLVTFIADIVLLQTGSDLVYFWYCAVLLTAIKTKILSTRQVHSFIAIFFILGFWFTIVGTLPGLRNAAVYLFLSITVLFCFGVWEMINTRR